MKTFGLSDDEVRQSKEKYGDNSLTEQKAESFWDKLLGNFGDPMIKILCVALIINVIFAIMGKTEWIETIGIAIAVILATFVSTISEYRNESAFQKLQEEASQIKCKVYRNGTITEIPINDIVVGDCILLQSGDKIPADGILVDGTIQVDQSVLNGEAAEAAKVVMPEDYVEEDEAMDFLNRYKVFRGSVICSGSAVMKVTTVGDKSVYGQIAGELQIEDDRETPLKLKLSKLANQISMFGYIGGIAIAVAYMVQKIFIQSSVTEYFAAGFLDSTFLVDIVEAVMLAVIIIVMAVPEGLPLMIAIVSAQNMGKMLKDNVLVRKTAGIETAGSLNILFSDKTGTITKGQLEAVAFVDGSGKEYKSFDETKGSIRKLLDANIRKNSCAVMTGDTKDFKVVGGNATERAILSYVAPFEDLSGGFTVVKEMPFNSTNKYSAVQVEGGSNLTLIKGAPEKIISRCTTCYGEDGSKQPFDQTVVNAKIDEMAARAIRVLAFATADEALGDDSLPDGSWTLIGVVGIRDEVRPESITAIREVKNAGVQVIMITGDRKDTAAAIAREAGLLESDSDIIMTSDELAKMTDDELKEALPNIRVVARALPTDKSRFVRVAQELNLVVGMTGDGVNDSPALKRADVGFAMGGGTEVAKEASEIVILDDNFLSIEKAILYGRTIFNSIRKFIVFQLTINVSAVLVSFFSPLIGMENPLSITQILWVNLVMDTLAALAFGGEPALERYMREKPKKRDEAIVSRQMWAEIGIGAAYVFIASLVFILGDLIGNGIFRAYGTDAASAEYLNYLHTGYFTFFILVAVFNAFNARTDKINLFDNIAGNKGFLKVMGIITVVQILMTYLGGSVLGGYGLNAREWIFVLAAAILIIPIDLIRKAVVRKTN